MLVANALRALKSGIADDGVGLGRDTVCVPGLVRISMRPRPGREYSAEYGSWLMLICATADALDVERTDFHAVDDDRHAAGPERPPDRESATPSR